MSLQQHTLAVICGLDLDSLIWMTHIFVSQMTNGFSGKRRRLCQQDMTVPLKDINIEHAFCKADRMKVATKGLSLTGVTNITDTASSRQNS